MLATTASMRCVPLFIAPVLVCAAEAGPLPSELGVDIFPYEPIYFALDPGIGDGPLSSKFQFSVAIRLYNPSPESQRQDGLYLAYSQTSFWDLQSDSKPFYDSSYRPEGWWHVGLKDMAGFTHLGLEPGIGHESNGRAGSESRSLNHAFLRLIGEWTGDGVTVFATPRGRIYLEKEDNDDIADYRGFVDCSGGVRFDESWGLSATARIGDGADHGSLQLELTHPLNAWTGGRMNGFAYVQWFAGWSETLIAYDQRSEQPRILFGYALTR
jgi:outer membrane phospholipase A